MEEDKDAKLICEQIVSFDEAARGGQLFPAKGARGSFGSRGQGAGQQGQGQQGAVSQPHQEKPRTGISSMPEGIWIQFPTVEAYLQAEQQLFEATADSDGQDHLVIYIKNPKSVKILPDNRNVRMDEELRQRLGTIFGEENVKIVAKPIEKPSKMN